MSEKALENSSSPNSQSASAEQRVQQPAVEVTCSGRLNFPERIPGTGAGRDEAIRLDTFRNLLNGQSTILLTDPKDPKESFGLSANDRTMILTQRSNIGEDGTAVHQWVFDRKTAKFNMSQAERIDSTGASLPMAPPTEESGQRLLVDLLLSKVRCPPPR